MIPILRWWRDIQNKKEIMQQNNIKVITFEQICILYEQSVKMI